MAKSKVSEFRAYPWIKERLKARAWNTKNPNRDQAGEVYTQHECLQEPEIAAALAGKKPENVAICSSDLRWIIEAKAGSDKLALALREAREYADAINSTSKVLRAPFATGVAGSEEQGFVVQTQYRTKAGKWETVRQSGAPLGRLPSKAELLRTVETDKASVDRAELSLQQALELSKRINESLHRAKVQKEQRALLVAILLIALDQDVTLKRAGDADVFLSDVNTRAKKVFEKAGRLALWEMIELRPSNESKEGVAVALANIVNELREADILHAAKSTDILGFFFESFLRYGNTSKELGIVLTPRHICWLAAEVLGVSQSDIVYDPATGTGGFLVAAFNRVAAKETQTAAQEFAKAKLYGAEDSGPVAALAFINMYFRGDGKHNLKVDSCFKYHLAGTPKGKSKPKFELGVEFKKSEVPAATRVMMNPPFSLKDDVQKEPDFVDHALRQLQVNGLLFAVLPTSVLYEKQFEAWRQQLLESNTLAAVVSFPVDLFYPVSTETVGVFLRKAVPHAEGSDVLWVRLEDDGFVKRKGFRVEKQGRRYSEHLAPIAERIRAWVVNGDQRPEAPGSFEFHPMTSRELIPQAHLGKGPLDPGKYEREAKSVLKELASQLWDQEHHTGDAVNV